MNAVAKQYKYVVEEITVKEEEEETRVDEMGVKYRYNFLMIFVFENLLEISVLKQNS